MFWQHMWVSLHIGTCCSCLVIGCGSFGCRGDGGVACGARDGAQSILQWSWFRIVLTFCTAVGFILDDNKHTFCFQGKDRRIKTAETGLTSGCVSSSPSSRVRAASCLDLCSSRLTYRIGLDKASITSGGEILYYNVVNYSNAHSVLAGQRNTLRDWSVPSAPQSRRRSFLPVAMKLYNSSVTGRRTDNDHNHYLYHIYFSIALHCTLDYYWPISSIFSLTDLFVLLRFCICIGLDLWNWEQL